MFSVKSFIKFALTGWTCIWVTLTFSQFEAIFDFSQKLIKLLRICNFPISIKPKKMLEKYEFPLKIENSKYTKEKQWNSPLCLLIIKVYRGQLWKGKQNNNSEEKIEKVSCWVIFFIIIKLLKHLVILRHCRFQGFVSLNVMYLVHIICIPFLVVPSIINTNLRNVLFSW